MSAFTERGIAGHRGRRSFQFYLNVDQGWQPSVQTVWLYDSPACKAINIRSSFTSQIIHTSQLILCALPWHYFAFYLKWGKRTCHIIFSKQWFLSSIIWQPCVPFTVASGAFVFLILPHKENFFSVSRNPAYTYLLLGTFFFFFLVTEKPSSKLKHTRGSGENGVDDIVFSDMDVRLKDKSVGWMLSCQ